MNISSLLIYVHPERAEDVRAQLEQLSGVEVHAVTAEGRMIVTVETAGDLEMRSALEQLAALAGVHATTLVYHHSETLDDESPANKENRP